ncbi:hypothetical protein B0H19DRAFT_1366790 [Mycena capillaripes]|nr:hypothetical protein B0H19DRAFT_1366790 [Mycena capillaripes]
MIPELPQELVDIIIDHLHNDIPSLKSCSLAAHSFLASARIHIFNKIEIKPPHSFSFRTPCQKFHQLLTSSPHITPLVDELCIVLVGSERSFERGSDGQYLEDRHVPWIMAEGTLSLILPLLDLKRLSIVENAPWNWSSSGRFSMNWDNLRGQLKTTLADVFSSPRLQSVHLRGMTFESPYQLLSLFSDATSLTNMSLSRLYFTQSADLNLWPESRPWRPQLRSLLLSDAGGVSISSYLVNPCFDLTHVRSLTAATKNTGWKKLIQATSSALEHLRLGYLRTHHVEDLSNVLGANLRSVHFSSTGSLFSWMDKFFRACPRDSRLETITFQGPVKSSSSLSDLNDTIESALIHLKSLKTVEIRLWIMGHQQLPLSEWTAVVRGTLTSLERRGILRLIEREQSHVRHGWE